MKKILVVDDDPDDASVIAMMLQQKAYEVEQAGDGQSGMRKAAEFKPDLVILDRMTPSTPLRAGPLRCAKSNRGRSASGACAVPSPRPVPIPCAPAATPPASSCGWAARSSSSTAAPASVRWA